MLIQEYLTLQISKALPKNANIKIMKKFKHKTGTTETSIFQKTRIEVANEDLIL
jgi:hypothetical protein